MKIDLSRPEYAQAFAGYLSGEWEEARQAFERLSARDPDNPYLRLIRGNILYSLGNLDQASAAYRQAIELKPDFGVAYYKLGVCEYRAGRLTQSLQSFQTLLSLKDQSHAMASYFVGLINSFLGDDEGALEGFSLLREASPQSRIANYYLAQLKIKHGRYGEALELLDELLEITPGLAEVHYLRGVVLEKMHRNAEAVDCFRRTLQLNPRDQRARTELNLLTGVGDL